MAELNDYSFEARAGEKTTWTVTHRLGDRETVSQNSTPFDAVIKAREHFKQKLQTDPENGISTMSKKLTEVGRQYKEIEEEQAQDIDAVKRRITELETGVSTKQSEIIKKSSEFQDLSVKERITRDEITSRRRDVVRFQAELEELRTHLYELVELRRILTEQLLRIKLDNHNLAQRENQIRQQLAL